MKGKILIDPGNMKNLPKEPEEIGSDWIAWVGLQLVIYLLRDDIEI